MSIRKKRFLIAATVLLALNILFIWGNSLLPGSISSAISGRVLLFVRTLLRLPAREPGGTGGYWIRKIAHFSEFCSLGFLSGTFFWMIRGKIFSSAALLSLMIACAEETIQMIAEGRKSSLLDVWIDFSGAMLGIAILLLLRNRRKTYKRRSRE